MEKSLTICKVVPFKTVFPETRRIGIGPGKSSEAYKAIKAIRGSATTKEDIQPWLNAPVLAFYDTNGNITYIVYRATCVGNSVRRFWQPELCLYPVKAYYACDLGAVESGKYSYSDTEDGVAELITSLAEVGVIVDPVAFMETLSTLKTEKIFHNRWSTLCCQNIELLKTSWHVGSYFDMLLETLIATKEFKKNWFNSSVAIVNSEGEREWFYLIHSTEVRLALSEVPATLQELMQFGISYGLCLKSPQETIFFTNADGEHYFAFSTEYMDKYRKCFKENPEYANYVFASCSFDATELEDTAVAAD